MSLALFPSPSPPPWLVVQYRAPHVSLYVAFVCSSLTYILVSRPRRARAPPREPLSTSARYKRPWFVARARPLAIYGHRVCGLGARVTLGFIRSPDQTGSLGLNRTKLVPNRSGPLEWRGSPGWQISHSKGGARRRRAPTRPRGPEGPEIRAAKGTSHPTATVGEQAC